MTRKHRKLLCTLLSLTMLLSLLSGLSLTTAADEITGYALWIGGKQVTAENAADVFGDGKVRFTPANGEDPAVLELNSYSYRGDGQIRDMLNANGEHYPTSAALFYDDAAPLELCLTGKNELIQQTDEVVSQAAAVYCRSTSESSLTIVGIGEDASLTAECGTASALSFVLAAKGGVCIENLELNVRNKESRAISYGVSAEGDLTLRSCSAEIESGAVEDQSLGLYSLTQRVMIADSTVRVTSAKANASVAILSPEGDLTITDSEVTAKGGPGEARSHGVWTYGKNITVTNSKLYAESAESLDRSDAINAGGRISISDSEVNAVAAKGSAAMGIINFNDSISISGSTVHAVGGSVLDQSSGIYSDHDISIRDHSTVEAIGLDAEAEYGASTGIISFGSTTVGGNSTVIAAADKAFESYGICAYDWDNEGGSSTLDVLSGTVTACGSDAVPSYGIFTSTLNVGNTAGVTAAGQTQAVFGKVKNPNAGTGWADFAGSGDGELIPVSTEGAELTEHKRIVLDNPAQHNPFADVEHGRFYYDAVLWAVANGVTKGTSDTAFQPNKSCTRAEVVTFLWRVCGEPAPTQAVNPFADVRENSYYYKAVLWAVETGITKGVDATHFAPTKTTTRGQAVTFLFRAARGSAPAEMENPFTDVKKGSYCYEAVLWALANGVTKGVDASSFAPDAPLTRGHIVTLLFRQYG